MERFNSESIELKNNQVLLVSEFNKELIVKENNDIESYIFIESNCDFNIKILDDSKLKLVLVGSGKIENFKLHIELSNNAYLNLYSGVISNNDIMNNVDIDLNGINSKYDLYELVIAKGYNVSGRFRVNHLSKDTTSSGLFNYISKDGGSINRNVESNINEFMTGSKSNENIKGMIMSENSMILAKPILMVSNDDVSASHGCAIGTIDDNEIYYLMSRGLTKEEAKKIIAMGLINPIIRVIKNEEYKNLVSRILEDAVGE